MPVPSHEWVAYPVVALFFLGISGFNAWLVHMLIAEHHQGVRRIGDAYLLFCAFGCVPFPFVTLVVCLSDDRYRFTYLSAVATVASGITAWGVWRARNVRLRSEPPATLPFRLARYFEVVGTLFALHLGLIFLYFGMSSDLADRGAATGSFSSRLTLFVIFLGLSQVSTTQAIRVLSTAFKKDWRRSDGEVLARDRQYRLVLLALAPCLLASLAAGPFLVGLLWRVLLLALAWRYTAITPSSQLRTIRCLVGHRTQREHPGPQAPPHLHVRTTRAGTVPPTTVSASDLSAARGALSLSEST